MFDGKRLADLRKYHGLGQKELASMLGVEANTVSAYENGLKTPCDKRKIKIAEIFDVSLDYFMQLIDEKISYKRNDVVYLPKDFPPEAIPKIKEHIRLLMNDHKARK
jgi:transcriptional regulator with XRE-family HTH domain